LVLAIAPARLFAKRRAYGPFATSYAAYRHAMTTPARVTLDAQPMRRWLGERQPVMIVALPLRRTLDFLLPYCFRDRSAWKHPTTEGTKLPLSQLVDGAPEEIRTPDP
jgi:hypothetical protein